MKRYRRNLPLLLLSVREQVRAHFQPTFRRCGITEQQWRILRLLHENRELGITEIADRCLILRPSIVGIIVRMEDLELVGRKADVADKRRVTISLTTRGKTLVGEILPAFETIYHRLEAALGERKLNQLYRLLDDVSDHLAQDAAENVTAAVRARGMAH
jgi:homoprotocatechuate degradation regulator HpaR